MRVLAAVSLSVTLCVFPGAVRAQGQDAISSASVNVPHVVQYSGVLAGESGRVEVEFALYAAQIGGEPLWKESQAVTPDSKGRYSVLLGSATEGGLPQAVFSSTDAKWLGVAAGGREQQARTPLLATPYTLKAADAELLAGHPASDFVLAGVKPQPDTATNVTQINTASGILGGGTGPTVSLTADPAYFNTYYGQLAAANAFTASNSFSKPIVSTVATGTAPLTIASTTAVPNLNASLLGGVAAAGFPQLALQNTYASNQIIAPSAPATTGTGHSSNFLWMNASVWNSTTGKAQNIGFQWRAEPLNNDTASPNANFSLLSTVTSATPQETGFKITANGIITFVAAQTFPGTASTTAANTFTGNQAVNGTDTVSGTVIAGGSTGAITGQLTANDTAANGLAISGNASASGGVGVYGGGYVGVEAMTTVTGSTSGAAVLGEIPSNFASSGTSYGVLGSDSSTQAGNFGVLGTSSNGTGVEGMTTSSSYVGVYALNGSTSGGFGLSATGVSGANITATTGDGVDASSTGADGVYAVTSATGGAAGVFGNSTTTTIGSDGFPGIGMSGNASGPSSYGVYGSSTGSGGYGLYGNANTGTGVYGQSGSSNGTGVIGQAYTGVMGVSTGEGYGVYGSTGSEGYYGVYGDNTNGLAGVYGSSESNGQFGVYGTSYSPGAISGGLGYGVVGNLNSPTGGGFSNTANTFYTTTSNAGVFGDQVDGTGDGSGVLATADGNTALFAANNSSSATMQVQNLTSATHNIIFETDSPNTYSNARHCTIDTSANLACTGTVTSVVKAQDKQLAMYSVLSTENWLEDFGAGHLSQGAAHVSLEAMFAQAASSDVDYHVFLTPNGDCRGLYIASKSATGFEVRELGGGSSSISFDYRIVAKRKGYESVRMEDVSEQAREMQAKYEARMQRAATNPRKMPRNVHPNVTIPRLLPPVVHPAGQANRPAMTAKSPAMPRILLGDPSRK